MLEGQAFTKTTLALVFSYSRTTTIFNECNWIWYPTRKTPTEISNRFRPNSIDLNRTQSNPIELNRTQSNPIELSRTQSTFDWVRLSSINRTFDLVRLVLSGMVHFPRISCVCEKISSYGFCPHRLKFVRKSTKFQQKNKKQKQLVEVACT